MKPSAEQTFLIKMNFMDLYLPMGKMAKLDLFQNNFGFFFYFYLFPKLGLLIQVFKFDYG